MKDSKNYSPKVAKLFRSLKRAGETGSMPQYDDPVEAVVYGLLCEQVPEAATGRMYKRIKSHFVDLNDLRVSRIEEILDVLRDASPAAEKAARAITQTLNAIFTQHDRISLDTLKHEGKRQAHKELSEISGMTPFACNFCFLTALGGHAIPLTAAMLAYLRNHKLVHPEATEAEIAGFLERQIAGKDAYAFYLLLRGEVEQGDSEKPVKFGKDAASKKETKKAAAAPRTTAPKTASPKKAQNHK
ncbi:MAG: hypothetical protein L0Y36_00965 [Planctomycetales bacterium]|nr:hypothetical protein [Planctomycetales bacterium]